MNTTDDKDDHDRGLDFDLPLLINRRRALGLMATSVGAVALAACGADSGATTGSSATAEAADGDPSVPEETARPVPWRRLERAERAHRERRRPQGHHHQLRGCLGGGATACRQPSI